MSKLNTLEGSSGETVVKDYERKIDSLKVLKDAVLTDKILESRCCPHKQLIDNKVLNLIPLIDPKQVAGVACDSRFIYGLRYTPLCICIAMLKHKDYSSIAGEILPSFSKNADTLTDIVSLYFVNNECKGGSHPPLSSVLRKTLCRLFSRLTLADLKGCKGNDIITLRKVMFLVHPKPGIVGEDVFKSIANNRKIVS